MVPKHWKNVLLFFGLAGSAAVLGVSEFRSQVARDGVPRSSEMLAELGTHLPNSLAGVDAALAVCLRATSRREKLFQPQSQQMQTAQHCANLAQQVFRRMPSHGTAFLVAAQSSEAGQDMAYLLQQSQRFAPSEGWLAERRIVLAQQNGLLDRRFAEKDLRLVLTTQGGAEFLAGNYISHPESRDVITRAVLGTTEANRRRFLNQVSKKTPA